MSMPTMRKQVRTREVSDDTVLVTTSRVLAGGAIGTDEADALLAASGTPEGASLSAALGILTGTGPGTGADRPALAAALSLATERLSAALGVTVHGTLVVPEASGMGHALTLPLAHPVTGQPVTVIVNDAPKAGEYLVALAVTWRQPDAV